METLIIIIIVLFFLYYLGSDHTKKSQIQQIKRIIPEVPRKKIETEEISLNQEKIDLFGKIENSNNHFFVTGKAGTGKSLLLQYIKKRSLKKVVVVAPTGVAAINVGGQTIHSLFYIPPSFVAHESLQFNQKVAELLRHVDMVLIDEISMVRADLMDAIDYRLRQSRDDTRPFGGVQIVMFGDLYQLPPVVTDRELHKYFSDNMGGFHFFNANVWRNTDFEKHELQEVFRQKDQNFRNLLNAIRIGKKSPEILNVLNDRINIKFPESDFIHLCSTNSKANQINNNKLAAINEQEFIYEATISGELDEKSYPAEQILKLKKGSQIMMLKNDIEKRWVNGTLGTISSLSQNEVKVEISGFNYSVPIVVWNKIRYRYNRETKLIEEEPISSFSQYPIRLAWAVTIHKAQGKTFDNIIVDLEGGAFASGQTYVALSRCTSLDGIFLTDKIYSEDIKVDPDVVKFMDKITKINSLSNDDLIYDSEPIQNDYEPEATKIITIDKETEIKKTPVKSNKKNNIPIPQELDW